MIKRIKAKNFLSLRDVNVELRSTNALVGPNMSGKSNLIEYLKFLQEAVNRRTVADSSSALQQAFSRRGGFKEVAWKGQTDEHIAMELAAELLEPSGRSPQSYNYDFSVRLGEYGFPVVETERLTRGGAGKAVTILDARAGKERVLQRGEVEPRENPQNTLGLGLEMWVNRPFEGFEFSEFIKSWRFYHLVPALMRESNPPNPEEHLAEHGENLSAWLLTLQTHTEEFQRIKQACRDVLPGLDEILFQPVRAKTPIVNAGASSFTLGSESAKISIGSSEKYFKNPINLSRMSDGELAFLALMSLILAPEELTPPLLCIEEPENHLHPRLLEILANILSQRQAELGPRAFQVIITTHSPLLIDKLSIDDLIVFGKKEGATKATRVSSKKGLKQLLSRKETSLGDLWYSGALSDS
jgi:predicted ATPase